MKQKNNPVRVAVAQLSPVFLDREATIKKVCQWIGRAAEGGARLVVFPEVCVAAYPDWVWLVPNSKKAVWNELYARLVENAVTVPDAATQALCRAAKKAGIYVAVGINERNSAASNASLYNSLLFIGAQGKILGVHRKLVPTGGERLIWAQGDGATIQVFDTPLGRVGGLICWENYMPLARQAMYDLGTQIYLAPTWDSSESWLLSLRHIAKEGGMYVLGCCTALRMADIPDDLEFKPLYPAGKEWVNPGNSCIIDPNGQMIAGPAAQKEEILYADLDLHLIRRSKWLFDAAGHYSRPDVFSFSVNRGTEK